MRLAAAASEVGLQSVRGSFFCEVWSAVCGRGLGGDGSLGSGAMAVC